VNDVSPARFRRHLEAALELGYRFVPASELAGELTEGASTQDAAHGGRPNKVRQDRLLAVTFDDGARSVATVAAPILASYGIPWTVFIVTDWASGRHKHPDLLLNWADVEHVVAHGGLVGSHSVSHRDLGTASFEDARYELEASKDIIARHTGLTVTEFAIPLGQSANWRPQLLDLAREAGFRWVYAQAEAPRPSGTAARTFITRYDDDAVFRAALGGAFDRWEEWY
jgi:peptidoglycan/xylan/chitin deacetylase (PgdA/CDA1 family)